LVAFVGFGIQNKHSMVFFGVAIVLAILLTLQRVNLRKKMDLARRFRCPCHRASEHHLEIDRGWPTWCCCTVSQKSNKNVVLSPWEFFFQQITLTNPATFPLWFGGLIWLLVSTKAGAIALIAFTYLIAFTEFVVHAREELYLAPAYRCYLPRVALLFSERARGFSRCACVAQTGDCVSRRRVAVVFAPVVLPILSPEKLLAYMRADSFRGPTNGNVAYCGITNSLPTNSAGGDGAARSRGSTPACPAMNRKAYSDFFARIMERRCD